MKLYGVMVVQNEADVIQDTLDFLQRLNIYEAIFFYDMGSEDDTYAKAKRYEGLLHAPQVLNALYTNRLRYDLLAQHRSLYQPGDWVAIIDADELYAEDPVELIRYAEEENASCIKTYQAEFILTDLEVRNLAKEDPALPIHERRKFYLIDWSEKRFFKYLPDEGLFSGRRACSRRLLNRHYPCRTPEQIKTRIRTRLENRRKASGLPGRSAWPQIFSRNWRDYLGSHRLMHEHTGGALKFGIPPGVGWKDYFSFKDPFSWAIPQITTALQQERIGADTRGGGVVSFQNRYAEQVALEVKETVRKREWLKAIRGTLVLTVYRFRRLLNAMGPRWGFTVRRCRDIGWNTMIRLRRALGGKPTGSLGASPNPIVVSGDSGAATTSVAWSALRSTSIELRTGSPDGPVAHQGGPSGRVDLRLEPGALFLLDAAPSQPPTRENTLARVTISIVKGDSITV